MDLERQLILVDSDALPSVYLRVLEAKRLISKGIAKNSTEACKIAEISRSAFYKYKDSVFVYEEKSKRKTVTFYFRLSDDPGVLSSVLSVFYNRHANIMTINQNIPVDGVADLTITVRIRQKKNYLIDLKADLSQLDGVVDVRRI